MSAMPPVTCVACGENHIETEDDLRKARRVGISFVSDECEWTLRYPGKTAAAVIADLERRLSAAPAAPATDVRGEPMDEPADEPWSPPAEGIEGTVVPGQQGAPGERLCPVCHGDGELVSVNQGADNMEEPTVMPCPRCASTGRIAVSV